MDLISYIFKIAFGMSVVAMLPGVKSENVDKTVLTDISFENLLNRLEILEAREKMRENENMELKRRVLVLESFAKKQQSEISDLKEAIDTQNKANQKLQDRVLYLESRDKVRDMLRTNLTSQNKRIQSMEWFIKTLENKLSTEMRYRRDEKEALNVVERSNSAVRQIQKRENEMNVAFFAYLTNHIEHPGVHQVIVFDHVTTNIGNAYNAFVGDFRAPVAGTYVFATSLLAGDMHLIYHFKFMLNGQTVSNIYLVNGGTASQEVVLQLKQGDDVSIHNMDAGNKLYGSGYSTFSGFLLQQDYSSPSVVGK